MTWTFSNAHDYRNVTTGQTAWTLTAGTIGDLRVIEFLTGSASVNISTLSGGGVTTWARAGSVNAVSSSSLGSAFTAELWWGPITSNGTALTITYAGTVGTTSCRGNRSDFRSARIKNQQPNYSVVHNAFTQTNNITSTSPLTWPSLTTTRDHQLVVGVMGNDGTGGSYAGSSTGYTYYTDADVNYHIYRLLAAASETEAATMTFTGTDGWYAMQTIFDDGYVQPGLNFNQAVSRAATR